jgi:hypothetical protein
MAFWNEAALEPKRKFKFLIRFGAASGELPTFIAKKCDKPSFDVSEIGHDFLGHKFYYPGKVTWKEVTATVIDPAGSGGVGDEDLSTITAPSTDVTDAVYKLLLRAGYQSPTAAGAAITGAGAGSTLRTMAKGTATRQFDQIQIIQVDANGDALETWTLNNAWLKSVNFGNLDYSSDDINEVNFTFRYDWADVAITSTSFDSSIEP